MEATEKDTDRAERQARAKLDSIVDVIHAIATAQATDEDVEYEGEMLDRDTLIQYAQENALSVQVKAGWHSPGSESEDEEFEILLCTGGPAVRITGDLGQFNTPENPQIEYQDWFTSWIPYHNTTAEEDSDLQEYCELFYFGE